MLLRIFDGGKEEIRKLFSNEKNPMISDPSEERDSYFFVFVSTKTVKVLKLSVNAQEFKAICSIVIQEYKLSIDE